MSKNPNLVPSLARLAQEVLRVQDACNLSGVVHSWSRALNSLWAHAEDANKGTDWVNEHPINQLWADKVAQLTGTQAVGSEIIMRAYGDVRKLAEDDERPTPQPQKEDPHAAG